MNSTIQKKKVVFIWFILIFFKVAFEEFRRIEYTLDQLIEQHKS